MGLDLQVSRTPIDRLKYTKKGHCYEWFGSLFLHLAENQTRARQRGTTQLLTSNS
jgi:hypothetical protein